MLPAVGLDLLALHMLVGDLFLPQVLATEASDLKNPQIFIATIFCKQI